MIIHEIQCNTIQSHENEGIISLSYHNITVISFEYLYIVCRASLNNISFDTRLINIVMIFSILVQITKYCSYYKSHNCTPLLHHERISQQPNTIAAIVGLTDCLPTEVSTTTYNCKHPLPTSTIMSYV